MVTEAVQECSQGRGTSRVGVGCLHKKLLNDLRLPAAFYNNSGICPLSVWVLGVNDV